MWHYSVVYYSSLNVQYVTQKSNLEQRRGFECTLRKAQLVTSYPVNVRYMKGEWFVS